MESEKILARPVSGELARVGSTLTVAMQMETNYLPQLANRPASNLFILRSVFARLRVR